MPRYSPRLLFTAEETADSEKQAEPIPQSPMFSSNPYSRWQQKRAIRREYAAAKAPGGTARASETAAKAAKETKKAERYVARHRKGFLVAGGIAAMLVLLLHMASSFQILAQGVLSGIGASTYPSADSDMLAAEEQYCAMEDELRRKLDNYEAEHTYDEYHFELDEIKHDPYNLISLLTALMGGEWTIGEVQDTLQMFFDRQYILKEEVFTETRYRTEVQMRPYIDAYGNRVDIPQTVRVPYSYSICTVKLQNFDLSHLPVYLLDEDKLSVYAMYMGVLGNRPDLFSDSDYVGIYGGNYDDYDIPPEALEDETFAAMIEEAEKYLGFPYVWGGSKPETSFDCSGFVSWVVNHSGWNVGRLTAQGLYDICTPVSAAQVKPGDLVFFVGTYDTPGVSHVGIYVGNNKMIHCGDPISYTDLTYDYWRQHFYAYGRLH